MWQAQVKGFEREKRRKEESSAGSYLGHTVKNCMTVIESMGRYQVCWSKADPVRSASFARISRVRSLTGQVPCLMSATGKAG